MPVGVNERSLYGKVTIGERKSEKQIKRGRDLKVEVAKNSVSVLLQRGGRTSSDSWSDPAEQLEG